MTYTIRVHHGGGLVATHTGDLRVTEGGALLILAPREEAGGVTRIVAGYAPNAWTRVVTEAV